MTKKAFQRALGLRIQKVRRRQGYSQDRLALEGSFSRGTMSKIERGHASPEAFTVYRIAEVLGVSVGDLMKIDH